MIELFPRSSPGYVQFAYCAVELGRYEEALAAIKEGRVVEDSQDLLALLGCTYARMGRRDEALEVLRRLEKPSPATAYVQPYLIARIDAALGDSGAALTALEKACEERSEYLVTIEASGGLCMDPAWKGLREEPRFKELLKRTGRDKWPRDLPPGFIRLQ
jgi:tetratricopeptide (TPR) repeat protein